ncbi:Bacterial regulatory protein, tetR family [Pseudovibrio axinellae]|uniref:Bacterial regulatory protein, tetR family n=1 Tax=Pseudovibrio axinellae TaxID=989403 RepID=A0A161V6L9_9HYPH|nr:TetR/AcrR family transcriptional regulator [Pseudovibrio axinellae]KZL20581.1 Bacterial regulatory protein, tetR family [Pseudovibrio axinellae]SER28702.1 transcriptional regulator, TetR family [Pseudovibrio axinellae]
MTKKRLAPEDWFIAGFEALAKSGPAGLKVEPIARDLQTTKGSFYWHFKDLSHFKKALLERWRVLATEDVIASVQEVGTGGDRLVALTQKATTATGDLASLKIETTIREWARHDELAAETMAQIDAHRIKYVFDALEYEGPDKQTRAQLIYAAHLGLKLLRVSAGIKGRAERHMLLNLLKIGEDNVHLQDK